MTHARIGRRSRELLTGRRSAAAGRNHGDVRSGGRGEDGWCWKRSPGFARPDAGRILLDDAIVFDAASRVNLPPRRRRCGICGRRDALFPHMTVRQNLMFAAGRMAAPGAHATRRRNAGALRTGGRAGNASARSDAGAPAARRGGARADPEPKVLLVDDRGAEDTDEALLRLVRTAFDGPVLCGHGQISISAAVGAINWRCWRAAVWCSRGAAREVMEQPESVEAARLAGISQPVSGAQSPRSIRDATRAAWNARTSY